MYDNSTYENWLNGLDIYQKMYEKGLKKQANKYIRSFINEFESSISEEGLEKILCRFCKEFCDEDKYPLLVDRGNGSLPYELSRVIWNYLKRQCELENMPHMRWAFQIYGKYYNPFNSQWELNMLEVLKKAYEHKDCDQETVNLYFNEMVELLYWGAHHFPEGCIITKETYEETVKTAVSILAEKQVESKLIEKYRYYVKLYQCFYEYEESERKKDFYELCEKAGIEYRSMPTYYYRK